jgi:general secretion pathway protein B
MSFILDALRKSENERQRGAAPGVAHVPFAIPRPRVPTWALAVMIMLGLSLVALGGAWWQSTQSESAASATLGRNSPTTDVPLAIPAPSERVAAEPVPPAPSVRTALPLGDVIGRGPDGARAADSAPAAAPSTRGESRSVLSTTPAATSAAAPPPRATLPSAAALAAEGVSVPELRLELHVYHRDRPRDRLVIINGNRYREGEPLAEGPRVVAIDPTGAVLSYQGREFLLTPE